MHVLEAKQRLGLLDEAPNYPKPPSVKAVEGVARAAALRRHNRPGNMRCCCHARSHGHRIWPCGNGGAGLRGRCAQRSGPGGRPSKFSGRC